MNWFQKAILRLAGKQMQRWFLNIGAFNASWMDSNYETYAREGYQQNPYVFAALDVIAKTCSGINWIMYDTKGENNTEIPNHPVTKLLFRPNPLQGKGSFFQALVGYLYIGGEVFITGIGPDDKRKPPLELYALRPDRMGIELGDQYEPIKRYKYTVDIGPRFFEPREILHLKFFNPLDDWRGMSPLRPGARSVDQNNASRTWNVSLLQNGARPSGFLVTEGNLTDEQFNRNKAELRADYSGPENAGLPKLLEGGVKWQDATINPKDMDWLEGSKLSAREVSICTGVPSELLGDNANKTYSNYKEARKALYEETVLPLLDFIRDELNNWLVPRYGDNLFLDYDRDDIEALQEDRSAVWDRAYKGWENSLLTRNEAKEMLGYPTDDKEGDVYKVAFSTIFVPKGQLLVPVSSGSAGGSNVDPLEDDKLKNNENFKQLIKGGDAFSGFRDASSGAFSGANLWKKMLTNEQRIGIWRAFDTSASLWEKKINKIMASFFADQLDTAIKAFPSTKKMQFKEKGPDPEDMLDWAEENKKLLVKLSPGWLASAEQGYDAAKDLFGFDLKFSLVREEMFKWIDTRGAEQVKRINDTTKQAIRSTLSLGIAGGENMPELQGRVKKVFADASSFRAEMIARTETHNTVLNGAFLTYEKAGVEKKEWLATMDDRVRDSHAAMDGEMVPIGEPFSNGLMFPGDPSGPPEEVINCRCALLPVVD